MKIKEALKKAKRKKKRIYSISLGMYEQGAKNLVYWLFVSPSTENKSRVTMEDMLRATDWELED